MDETARQTLRAEVLKESFAAAGEARHGFIGYMPPLAVADNSLEPITNVRKGDDAGWMPKNFVTGQAKKGNGPDSYLMYIPPLAPGSPFVDTHKIRLRETKGAPVDPDRNFKPPGTVKTSTNKTGYVYMEMSPDPVDPKDLYAKHKDRAPLKNFVTAPARRGGKGVFAPDIYFEKPSEYLHSDYEAEKKLRLERMKKDKEIQGENPPFRSRCGGVSTFAKDSETFARPATLAPLDEGKKTVAGPPPGVKRPEHPRGWLTTNPPRRGEAGMFTAFPEHKPSPPRPAKTREEREAEAKERADKGFLAWRPTDQMKKANPMPSVVLNRRNMRVPNFRAMRK